MNHKKINGKHLMAIYKDEFKEDFVNKKDFYVCLVVLVATKDRFKRILKPTRILYIENKSKTKYSEKNMIKLIPDKGKKFSYDSSIFWFETYEECVLHFNQQIDEQSVFLKEQVMKMREKYDKMINMKINLREKKLKRVLKRK